MGGAPRTVNWRGVNVDPETAAYLDAVAAEVTRMTRAAGVPDFTLTPIPGFGSYRTNAASAGTDSGGGHCDINAEPLTDRQARILESAARKWGGCAYFRPRVSPRGIPYGWQRHVHVLRSDCGDLSTPARTQVGQYRRGLNGLADNGPDTGDRSWVDVTWGAVKHLASTIQNIGSKVADTAPKPTPAAQEDDMPYSPKDLAATVWNSPASDIIPAPKSALKVNPGNVNWTPASYLQWTYESVQSVSAQVAGLSAAVRALAESKGVNGDAVVEAVRSEVAKAMDGLSITLTTPGA